MTRRNRQNFLGGTLSSPVGMGATTMNSANLNDMAVIASPTIAVVVLDPLGTAGDPEIVHVTAHTAASTSATITRAQEGTAERTHLAGVTWKHAPVAKDFNLDVVPTAELPAAAAAMDGVALIEDAGAGDRNLIVYAGGQRFRFDGGAPV